MKEKTKYLKYKVEGVDLFWLCIFCLEFQIFNQLWIGFVGFLVYMAIIKQILYKRK